MKTVTVYTTPTCGWCGAVKSYLEEKNITFDEVDVSVDMEKARQMVEKSGQYGVPVVDIDGDIVVGFDRAKLDSLLAAA